MDKDDIRELLLAKGVTPEAKFGIAEIAPLIELLNDIEGDVRDAAVTALAKIGEPAVAPLINELKHGFLDTRRLSAAALSKMAWETAGLLEAILPTVRFMQEINYRERRDTFFEVGYYHRQIASNVGQAKTMALLADCFKDEKQYDRALILLSLAWLPPIFDTSAFVDPLLPMLLDKDNDKCLQAATILSHSNRGLQFKKIILDEDAELAYRIGLEKTRKIIAEFFNKVIRNGKPEKAREFRTRFAAFYARTTRITQTRHWQLYLYGELMPPKIKAPAGGKIYKTPLQRRAVVG